MQNQRKKVIDFLTYCFFRIIKNEFVRIKVLNILFVLSVPFYAFRIFIFSVYNRKVKIEIRIFVFWSFVCLFYIWNWLDIIVSSRVQRNYFFVCSVAFPELERILNWKHCEVKQDKTPEVTLGSIIIIHFHVKMQNVSNPFGVGIFGYNSEENSYRVVIKQCHSDFNRFSSQYTIWK